MEFELLKNMFSSKNPKRICQENSPCMVPFYFLGSILMICAFAFLVCLFGLVFSYPIICYVGPPPRDNITDCDKGLLYYGGVLFHSLLFFGVGLLCFMCFKETKDAYDGALDLEKGEIQQKQKIK